MLYIALYEMCGSHCRPVAVLLLFMIFSCLQKSFGLQAKHSMFNGGIIV